MVATHNFKPFKLKIDKLLHSFNEDDMIKPDEVQVHIGGQQALHSGMCSTYTSAKCK